MQRFSAACVLIIAASIVMTGCGRDESVASKSAAAYREAQAKGIKVGSDGHGHGGAPQPSSIETTMAVDHAAMNHAEAQSADGGNAAMDHAAMGHAAMDHAAMDHAAMGHAATSGSISSPHSGMQHGAASTKPSAMAMDHAAMGHGASSGAATSPHAGMQHDAQSSQPAAMDHAAMGHATSSATTPDPHASMQHGVPQPSSTADANAHAGHAAADAGGTKIDSDKPRSNADLQRIAPSSTLAPDDFDRPSPVAVAEAAKAIEGGGHDAHDKTTTSEVYVCPMHPEVTSDKPGTCPKCGMALVRKK